MITFGAIRTIMCILKRCLKKGHVEEAEPEEEEVEKVVLIFEIGTCLMLFILGFCNFTP